MDEAHTPNTVDSEASPIEEVIHSFHVVRTRHRPSNNEPPEARTVCLDLPTIQGLFHLRQVDAAE
eukprot:741831-Hanusia_phi.AAC.1